MVTLTRVGPYLLLALSLVLLADCALGAWCDWRTRGTYQTTPLVPLGQAWNTKINAPPASRVSSWSFTTTSFTAKGFQLGHATWTSGSVVTYPIEMQKPFGGAWWTCSFFSRRLVIVAPSFSRS